MPANVDSERAVLGSMMIDEAVADQVFPILDAEDFYLTIHRSLYEVMFVMHARGEPLDVLSVINRLRVEQRMGDWSPLEIRQITTDVTTTTAASHHAKEVREVATLRRLVQAGQGVIDIGMGEPESVEAAVLAAEALVFHITGRRREQSIVPVAMSVSSTLDRMERLQTTDELDGLPTGLRTIDAKLGGLQPSTLYIVAARPSVGKTAFAANVGVAAARAGTRVGLFSLEMSHEQITQRIICGEAGVSMTKLRHKMLTDQDWKKMAQAAEDVAALPIDIIDEPSTTIFDIASICRRLKKKHLGLVIVDYIQIMNPSQPHDSREREVAEISRGLKLLAKELSLPIIACSQLNRESLARAGGRPRLSDLRESGALEQDPDVVILLHRDDDRPDEIEAIVAKNRQGPTGTIHLRWHPEVTRFEDRVGVATHLGLPG